MLRYVLTNVMLSLLVRYRLRRGYADQLVGVVAAVLGGGNLIAGSDLNFPIIFAGAPHEEARHDSPVAVFGVGIGDTWAQTGNAAFHHAFTTARLIDVTVRDRRSQGVWDRLLVGNMIPASGLAYDPGLLAAARCDVAAPNGPVGLCLTHPVLLRYHAADDQIHDDIETWFGLSAQGLVATGHRVVLLTNGSPGDRRLRDAIGPRLGAESEGAVSCAPDFATPGDLVHSSRPVR